MSLIARVRHQLSNGSSKNIASSYLKLTRHFSQTATLDDEEEEFDQRRLPTDYDPKNFDPTEHPSPPTPRVWRLVDEVAALTLAESTELAIILMKKKDMKIPPVVGMMKSGAGGAATTAGVAEAAQQEAKPEKTAFELKMESFDAASKLKVIKEIRSVTDLGLKEAKDLVEKTPTVFKKGVSKDEAEKIIEKMKAVGAMVVME